MLTCVHLQPIGVIAKGVELGVLQDFVNTLFKYQFTVLKPTKSV
jgi:hypothetical protein